MFEIVLKVTRMQGKHSINEATSLAYAYIFVIFLYTISIKPIPSICPALVISSLLEMT